MASAAAIRVVCDVLSGLEEAHALGIVHRGITAEHVMVTPEGEGKLGGFGLAKSVSDVSLTQAGAVLGDARYISPEQVMGTGSLDGRADLYSVGVLLFHALTGRVPFDAANDFDIMMAQVSKQPPRPSSLNPGIAPELDRIVLTALAKRPEERFPECGRLPHGAGSAARQFHRAGASCRNRSKAAPVEAMPKSAVPQFLMHAEPRGLQKKAFLLSFLCVAIGLIVLFFATTH